MHYLYILKSKTKERTYIGITGDIAKRLKEHNSGFVQSTKGYRPLVLIHTEEYKTKRDARMRELYLKKNSSVKESLYKNLDI